jgi:hypothetical protein
MSYYARVSYKLGHTCRDHYIRGWSTPFTFYSIPSDLHVLQSPSCSSCVSFRCYGTRATQGATGCDGQIDGVQTSVLRDFMYQIRKVWSRPQTARNNSNIMVISAFRSCPSMTGYVGTTGSLFFFTICRSNRQQKRSLTNYPPRWFVSIGISRQAPGSLTFQS